MLAQGELTEQSRASLRLASVDAEARARGGVVVFRPDHSAESLAGERSSEGFDTVKIKGFAAVPDHVRMRIDFNATMNADQFLAIADALPADRIDFIEDPCLYDPETWMRLKELTGIASGARSGRRPARG